MAIPKFTTFTSGAVPVEAENIDTDQIIPARFLKATERKGFGDNLFRDWRYDAEGRPIAAFPLNDPRYEGRILHLELQQRDFTFTLVIGFQKVLDLIFHFSTHNDFLSISDFVLKRMDVSAVGGERQRGRSLPGKI